MEFNKIEAFVRLVKPTGYCFCTPVKAFDGDSRRDVYLHCSAITNEGFVWKSLETGNKITLNTVIKSVKGYSCTSATLKKVKKIKE